MFSVEIDVCFVPLADIADEEPGTVARCGSCEGTQEFSAAKAAKPLSGKVALVTGGSRGIGAAIAKELADQGADVALSYAASADKAEAVAKELKSTPPPSRPTGRCQAGRGFGTQSRHSARPLREARGGCRHRRLPRQSCRGLYHWRVAKCRRRLRCLTRDNNKLRGGADPKITGTGFALICLRADPWRTDLDFGEMTDSRQIRQTSALLYCPREATSAALGPYFGHPSRLNFDIVRRDSMLRRYATVAFAVLGLLVFDWEDPSPEATVVLDAFDGIAEIVDTLETDSASKRGAAMNRQVHIERLM